MTNRTPAAAIGNLTVVRFDQTLFMDAVQVKLNCHETTEINVRASKIGRRYVQSTPV